MPLGIVPDTDYPTTRLVLEPGETLLMCTDGLIETGGHDLRTGWERIRSVFEDEARGGPGPGPPRGRDRRPGPPPGSGRRAGSGRSCWRRSPTGWSRRCTGRRPTTPRARWWTAGRTTSHCCWSAGSRSCARSAPAPRRCGVRRCRSRRPSRSG
ncbi:SpoIIE family protein phosphatase [Streptomyces sp. M19]